MFIKKVIKRSATLLTTLLLCSNAIADIPEAPSVKAKSYVLMEHNTGKILKELNSDKKLAPASLTKVMTAYVVFDELSRGKLKLTDTVKISKKAWKTTGSKTFVKEGDHVLVEDLVKGMIIQSGNDASVALAEHIAGSIESFSELMNYHAKKIGMNNSYFKNPTGLPSRGHYTTAMDLSILTKAMIDEFPDYYYIYQLKKFTYQNIEQFSRNRLLKEELGFDGLKTGYTREAGYCYIGSSKRGESRVIVTLLGEPSPEQRFEDAKSLVNYGFRFFETHMLLESGKAIKELTTKVKKGETNELFIGTKDDVVIVLARGQVERLQYDVDIIQNAIAPIKKGKTVGVIKINLDGKTLKTMDLVTLNNVNEGTFFKKMKDSIKESFEGE